MRGASSSDGLRKQLAKEGVNVVFRKGQTLGKYLMNGGHQKIIRGKMLCTRFPVIHAVFAILEKPRSGLMKEKSNTNAA